MTTTSGEGGSFHGKYRATVLQNIDPEQRGRLQLMIPDVLGPLPSTWAEACVPLAGPTGPPMGVYMVPPIGAGVWVEFERGDPNYPVWVGCRWGGQSDIPLLAKAGLPASPNIVMQTLGQQTLVISDAPPTPATGGIVLKSATNAMVVVNDSGIYITNGKGASITLVGPTVLVNNGALSVT
ncbi:phage baseplate assembly protein V [Variovorax sp. JS1663]|uniref:phage baseplate assembly protein V n=1 Tax=Variovorax sp. JS1663 TaxID=1851577 RepID=UPI000B341A3E|nr:phage baseplate assembly protein V [Variovorax sp. JS1663]OUL98514.1 baseplate assembly protein [Variovorax sp. JS1663]